jgi:polyisoprenoid-binding protein YceI
VATGPALTGTVDDQGEDNYPTGGKLTITGTNSSIVLDADTGNPDTVLMTIDENGAVTSETISWDDLDSPQPLF